MALVFIDLDGTMLDHGKPAKNIVATIKRLKANGHIPIIASGRVPHLLYGVDKVLGIDSYVCANGSYINYQGQVVYEKYISESTVQKMIDTCDKIEADLVLEGVSGYVAYSKRSEYVDAFSDHFGIERPIIDRTFHLNNRILSLIVFDARKVDQLRIDFPELMFIQSSRFGFDVNLKGDLKAEGIRWLVNYLNYPPEDVFAIGDGMNDISMLKAVNHGIAMGNSHPELLSVATYVTSDVGDEGVANALHHFNLI